MYCIYVLYIYNIQILQFHRNFHQGTSERPLFRRLWQFLALFMAVFNAKTISIKSELLAMFSKIDEFKGTWRAIDACETNQEPIISVLLAWIHRL